VQVGIRGKLLLILGCIVFAVLSVHAYLQVSLQRAAFEGELQKRTNLLKENLYQRAHSQAETLKRLVAEDIASYNLFSLTNKIQQTAQGTPELEYVIVLDNKNKVYVHTAEPEQQQSLYIESEPIGDQSVRTSDHGDIITLTGNADEETFMEYKLPINIGASQWGYMLLGYSLEQLNEQIIRSQKESEEKQESLTIKTAYIAAFMLLIAYILISHLSQRFVSPIIALSSFAKDLAEGDFTRAHRITSTSHDEVGRLTHNFSNMALKLEASQKQQVEYNQTLEKKVSGRTEELNKKNDELIHALKGLEESQQQLIHSEKMAALGQLIAGIAHEINTPLGAIQASVGNTRKYLSLFNEGLPTFLASSGAAEKEFLCALLAQTQYQQTMSTREERKARRELVRVLDEHNVGKSDELADMLVDMNLHEDITRLLPSLSLTEGFNIVELAHRISGIGRNSETIRTAVGRASKVVFALKHFAHHDNSGSMISSDINQGIHTVLVLYQSLLKQGCEVIEHFGALPVINCYPDELNQVWTNLIHNALHAMQNKGVLTIETKLEEQHIIVSITDNGLGIPLEIQPKIYDSFFTTKPAGEGSGLGLGICKRIVDKHHGTIDFTSEPGRTTFMVILPVC